LPTAVDNQNSQAGAQKLTEVLSNLVILVMLIIVFRAVLAPLVTLGPAVLVLQTSEHVIGGLAEHGLQVSTVTETMLVVLLLGAGTDYGLFLILRVREEIAGGAEPRSAIERSARYVGESITSSGGTVIVALLCLALASFGLYSGLGPALALGVAMMLLAALTLTPALLAVFGRTVFWPTPIRHAQREGLWARLADIVIARPVVTLVLGVVFLGGLALAATAYTSSGFGGTSTGPPGSGSAAGTAAINAHYPAAVANPTVVLLVYKSSVWTDLTPVQNAENDLAKKSVFASVNGLLNPNGTAVSTQQLETIYQELGPPSKLPATQPPNSPVSPQQYAAYRATTQFVSPNGKTVQFYTTLKAGAPTTTAALNATPAVRGAVADAMHHTGTTVTSAGLILAATFGVAGLTGATTQIKELGTAIALGVLLDTFFVRTLLVPAIVILCGRYNWWPSKLARATRGSRSQRAPAGALGEDVAVPDPAARSTGSACMAPVHGPCRLPGSVPPLFPQKEVRTKPGSVQFLVCLRVGLFVVGGSVGPG
jgi:putative drug exporter of the RND superfamily